MAASLSSSRCSSGWVGLGEKRHSPIPYRIGPLDYHPPVWCKCQKKAVLWISWSDDNLGRHYVKCFFAQEGGCDFIAWYEGPRDAFVQSLLVDLRDAVWSLKKEKGELKNALADAYLKVEEQNKEVAKCRLEVAAAREGEAKKEELRGRVKRLEKERFLIRALIVALAAAISFMYFAQLNGSS